MSILSEFKAFAMRGNVIDLAVGVVIGAAFGKIVSSLVDNIIMPLLGVATSGVDFKDLALTLKAADPTTGAAAVTIGYGAFAQTIIDFTIIAFAIFMVIKFINRFAPKPAPAKPAPKGPSQEELLTQIRDLLKKKK
jgi:large conductance mechanosensitive channel